jgi:methanogenic corrinoid protein MtbC1
LASVIEGDVIPRLVLAHRHGRSADAMIAEGVFGRLGREDGPDGAGSPVDTFTRCLLRGESGRALGVVRDLETRGVTFEALCDGLLEPTAALLETYWASDAYGFSDLTVALSRLQWILHELERDFGQDEAIHGVGHRVLLGAVPAEKHTFGVSLVSAVFHRAGWDVTDALVTGSRSALLNMVSEDAYPVIGLWVCRSCQMSGLHALVDELRRASLNPCMRVLLIGPPCGGSPEDLSRTGADGLAETALAAIEKAEELLIAAREQD